MGKIFKNAIKGAIAGAVGVWLMDRVTWHFYRNEKPAVHRQEKEAQVEGKYAPAVTAERMLGAFGIRIPDEKRYLAGRSVHYFMGMMPAVFYALGRHRMQGIGSWRGPLYGFALFLVFDEGIVPLLGHAAGPTAYPWQAHARGCIAHLVLGTTTDTVLNLLGNRGYR